MADAVKVIGLKELQKAFRTANRELARDLRTAIEQAGEPIRQTAQQRVRQNISGMARSIVPWYTIRTGVERGTVGFIVPAQRGVKTAGKERLKRPNLARLIAAEELVARDQNADRVVEEFDDALNEMAKAWARV